MLGFLQVSAAQGTRLKAQRIRSLSSSWRFLRILSQGSPTQCPSHVQTAGDSQFGHGRGIVSGCLAIRFARISKNLINFGSSGSSNGYPVLPTPAGTSALLVKGKLGAIFLPSLFAQFVIASHSFFFADGPSSTFWTARNHLQLHKTS